MFSLYNYECLLPIIKVSSLDSKHCEFVRIHQKPLRDAAFSCRGDGLLLTAAMDKTVRVTSMLSNTVVQRYVDKDCVPLCLDYYYM